MDLKNRFSGSVIFLHGTDKISILTKAALEAKISLREADLSGANLREADLSRADLSGAKNAPLIISGLRRFIQIAHDTTIRIGCQKHSADDWKSFSEDQIKEMDPDGPAFTSAYLPALIGLARAHKIECDIRKK